MDAEYIRWGLTALFGVILYFAKRMVDTNERSIETLKNELQNVKQDYLHKNDFREFKAELRTMFEDLKASIKDMGKHAE